jgi:N-acetylmuramic acid 6-phosphate etherase
MIVKASSFEGSTADTQETPSSAAQKGRTHSGKAGSIGDTRDGPALPGCEVEESLFDVANIAAVRQSPSTGHLGSVGKAAPKESAMTASETLHAQLQQLVSEGRNPRTTDIDLMSSLEIVTTINAEDRTVPDAVAKTLPEVARAVDAIVAAFNAGGRLVYVGAGTSGRLGVLDASECPPTYGVPPTMVVGLIAGGLDALVNASEGAEDKVEAGRTDLVNIGLAARDVVAGIAVSGRTPYVIGALDYARSQGATTVALTCNPESPIARMAHISIAPLVGPEVITGSTRMKSGTAQKLVLNMLSTASMVRIGKTYGNLMVDMIASNGKLVARAARMVSQATGSTLDEAEAALASAGNDSKQAILMILTGLEPDAARAALAAAGGVLRRAIAGTAQ